MKITSSLLVSLVESEPNRAPSIGMEERIGIPVLVLLLDCRTKPAMTAVCPFLTIIEVLAELLLMPGIPSTETELSGWLSLILTVSLIIPSPRMLGRISNVNPALIVVSPDVNVPGTEPVFGLTPLLLLLRPPTG